MVMLPTYARIAREHPEAIREPDTFTPRRLCLLSLLHADTIAIEFMLSMISLLAGLWLLMPFEVFSAPFPVLHTLFSETVCGLWLTALGGVRLAALWCDCRRIRQGAAFCAFLTWLNLLAWVWVTNSAMLSMVFFAVFAATSFWVFLRGPSEIKRRATYRKKNEK